jgi:hypothetical protein
LTSDSIPNPSIGSLDTISFKLGGAGDTSMARDFGSFATAIGPKDFHSPKDGDRLGIILEFEDSSISISFNRTTLSLSIYISADTSNIGVSVSPRMWVINATAIHNIPIASNPFSTTITANMLDSWLTIPFFPPTTLGTGSYIVGVEQTNGAISNKGFSLGRDTTGEKYSWGQTKFVYLNDTANPRWQAISELAGIRLNYSISGTGGIPNWCGTTTLTEESSSMQQVKLFPNPSNGLIELRGIAESDELVVRDVNGRMVHTQRVKENTQSIDLQILKDGLYFLHFKGSSKGEVQKLIIQH